MPPVAQKTYWRSLEDLADTPEFRKLVEDEFPSRVDELVDPLSRRRFLKVMGASMALAGLTGCDVNLGYSPIWPKERILPFAKRPEGRHPGTPVHYATAFERGGVARPLLAKSYDGRPVKVEGNNEHPVSQGWSGSDSQTQASVLSLYDPDRTKAVHKQGAEGLEASSWEAFMSAWSKAKQGLDNGLGLFVLAPASNSPSLAATNVELAGGPTTTPGRAPAWPSATRRRSRPSSTSVGPRSSSRSTPTCSRRTPRPRSTRRPSWTGGGPTAPPASST